MAKGYGFIDVSMKEVNYLFLKIYFGYMIIFRFIRHRYEKKYGKFKSEKHQEFSLTYMQFMYCINEYSAYAAISCLMPWAFIFYK